MPRSREEMQDIALYHMEKMNRRNQTDNKPKSLAEELADMERWNNLTPERRNQETPWGDWLRNMRDWMRNRKQDTFTDKFYGWLCQARKKELEAYHAKGTQFKDMVPWLREMSEFHLNL